MVETLSPKDQKKILRAFEEHAGDEIGPVVLRHVSLKITEELEHFLV